MAELKTFTMADLAKHTSKDSLYMAIHDKVYDCTGFIDEHPGGEEVLLDEAGHDATESFEDVGHSEEAREIMSKLLVGYLKSDGTARPKPKGSSVPKPFPVSEPIDTGSAIQYVIAMVVVTGCVLWKVMS
ncbi:hypothetical protein BG011_008996 [Mortierella polycephala]|uniref:Cytochrome b5 heme-binding domain-containing protein n=1 Tax=Mortierella polycephala TaxID=41804 RepID=A0A9P6TWM8_9FUNG|nr:hypothetical protein BG011_008996 [Mortierella polycephala]